MTEKLRMHFYKTFTVTNNHSKCIEKNVKLLKKNMKNTINSQFENELFIIGFNTKEHKKLFQNLTHKSS